MLLGLPMAMTPFMNEGIAAESTIAAQRQPSGGELLRQIERLSVVGNVLYVAAHPDDENTRLLAYLSRERLLRTAYLSLTRGDGGQNLIGSEQGPLLGLIRTQELLAARRIDGAEQFFTRARDFGYSKTPVETMEIWGKDAVLSDAVWIIRRYRPDVIITRFPPGGGETHGHHTASAMLAQEAFKAAADPKFHPEQVQQVGVWQARRIYWNRWQWGGRTGEDANFPKLDIGVYNPLLGVSYGELAAESRSMHKSQGFGSARSRGSLLEYFQTLGGDGVQAPSAGIFDGIDLTWGRVQGGARLAELLAKVQQSFDLHHPEASIPALLQARAELGRLPENPWKATKLQELDDVILGCAGAWLEVTAADHAAVPGGQLVLTASAINRSPAALRLREVRLPAGVSMSVDKVLANNEPWHSEKSITVPADAGLSTPYWLAEAPEKGLYTVRDAGKIGMPENPPNLVAEFVLSVGAAPAAGELVIRRPVVYRWTDPVAGERLRAVELTPPVLVNPEASVLMFPDGQPRSLRVRLKAGRDAVSGNLKLELPAGFVAEPAVLPFKLDKKGGETDVRFQLRPPPGAQTVNGTLRVVAEVGGERLSRGMQHIDYPHIPIQTLLPESEVRLCRFDLKKGKTRIGYIAGAGDDVPAALRQAGYEVTLLDDEALEHQPLVPSRFSAIVVGVRAYNTNPRMAFHYGRLMEYVSAGGNLIAQYNTNNRISKVSASIGPHPFEISQDRVTDENAAVTVELAGHPLLSRPNRITDADFAGWVQERGLYFADKWDAKYQTPLSMHDPGEPAKKGSVLVARHGKGAFIYTGLAFFRQLPAGVPGAYRLFANMIAYGQ